MLRDNQCKIGGSMASEDNILVKFVNDGNTEKYKGIVLSWLESDYNLRNKPKNHFWHNSNTISEAFDRANGLVLINKSKDFIGYMIWTFYGGTTGVEIDIVEVKEEYRNQGALKLALEKLCLEFPSIYVLSGNVLPQSEIIFQRLGWEKQDKRYIKFVKPSLRPSGILPNGRVIAVSSVDAYESKINPGKHIDSLKYFQVTLDANGQLLEPIVTIFSPDGYIRVYHDRTLITEGKPKHLFKHESRMSYRDAGLFILSEIIPVNINLFVGFIPELSATTVETRNPVIFTSIPQTEANASVNNSTARQQKQDGLEKKRLRMQS